MAPFQGYRFSMLLVEIGFWLSLSLLLYTYFGYAAILSACHPLIRRFSSRPDASYRPTVSIVLAAYNEASHIRAKLDNCLSLDYPANRLEILVGSDGSDDGTVQIVNEYLDRGVRLYAFQPRQGKMATVNRLVEQASGEICVFSDISEVFDRDALWRLVQHFADSEIGAVTGNHIYNSEQTALGQGTLFYWRFQRFLQDLESRLYSVCACDGTIYACVRSLYPFPANDTINDDVAVPLGILQRGKRVIFERQAVARGDVLRDTQKFFQQKIRGQAGKYQNFIANPRMFLPWPPARFLIFVSHSLFPVIAPWFLIGLLATNIALAASAGGVYPFLLAGQVAFYGAAFAGAVTQHLKWFVPFVSIPYYFVVANTGSIVGLFAYASRSQRAAWKKVD